MKNEWIYIQDRKPMPSDYPIIVLENEYKCPRYAVVINHLVMEEHIDYYTIIAWSRFYDLRKDYSEGKIKTENRDQRLEDIYHQVTLDEAIRDAENNANNQ